MTDIAPGPVAEVPVAAPVAPGPNSIEAAIARAIDKNIIPSLVLVGMALGGYRLGIPGEICAAMVGAALLVFKA
jgi:predicted esterase YcpF (UPF0227 family)